MQCNVPGILPKFLFNYFLYIYMLDCWHCCVCQDVHCLHTLGTSGNLVHVGKGMYLYMTM